MKAMKNSYSVNMTGNFMYAADFCGNQDVNSAMIKFERDESSEESNNNYEKK
jgi:hypothetical protein